MLTARGQAMAVAAGCGERPVDVARRFGVTDSRVAQAVRDARRLVDRIEMDMLAATKTGEECAYVIPYGPDYQTALDFGQWLIDQLRARDVVVAVETRRANNGLALLLRDATPYTQEQ